MQTTPRFDLTHGIACKLEDEILRYWAAMDKANNVEAQRYHAGVLDGLRMALDVAREQGEAVASAEWLAQQERR